ncbi:MAG: dTDP-4-dehydrorhamnose 3,5-epimerase [Desulfosarcinaceae bacterium]
METTATDLKGVLILEPKVFKDQRGFFMETYQQPRYRAAGIRTEFVQDNLSRSTRGTLRGLHFQIRHPQAKLVQVLAGEVFDVAVDLRAGSPSFGRWAGARLSAANHRQFYIPAGFAHGFAVLSETALFAYKCSEVYHPEDEGGLLWSDPVLAIDWPVEAPVLSDKDAAYPRLGQLTPEQLPQVRYRAEEER